MFILNTIVNRFGLAGGTLPFKQYIKLRDELDKSLKLTTEEFVGIAEADNEKRFIDEIVTRGEGITVTTTAASNYKGFPAINERV